jgi:hypothetical protein
MECLAFAASAHAVGARHAVTCPLSGRYVLIIAAGPAGLSTASSDVRQ